MVPILVGANPLVRLFGSDATTVTALASVWVVDWSVRGRGTALVLWHAGEVRALGSDPGLAYWLAQDFTRHFPEAAGLPWPEPVPHEVPVHVDLDLEKGLTATAGDVTVELSGVLDRRVFATDAFDLGGVPHGLSLVLAPVAGAAITVGGAPVEGHVLRSGPPERPSSSAFLAAAEVWRRA